MSMTIAGQRQSAPIRCRVFGFHKWSVWTPLHDQEKPLAKDDPDDDGAQSCQERTCVLCHLEVTRFWSDLP